MKKQISFGQVIAAATVASAMLAGCGGGGGGDATTLSATTPAPDPATSTSTPTTSTPTTPTTTPTPNPVVVPIATVEGIYNGTIPATNKTITALILADNHYYIMYSQPGVPASFDGVAFGLGTANGDSLSGDFKDINLTGGVKNGTLAGTYTDSKTTFGGTLAYTGNPGVTFTSTKDSSYATAPSLTKVAGVYTGTLAAGPLTAGPVPSETLQLEITDQGVMSGKLTCGCILEKASMSLNGNAYTVNLTFSVGDGTHPLHGQKFAGNAYFDAPNKRLVVAGVLGDAAQTPAMFVGTKP